MALDGAKGDLEQARANLEAWFDSGMDRVSGWYRKQTQWILLAMGLVAAVALNIDTVNIARNLYEHDDVRSLIVTQAEDVIERGRDAGTPLADNDAYRALLDCSAGTPAQEQRCAQNRLEKLGLPMGWSGQDVAWPWQKGNDLGKWFGSFPWSSIPGWLLTALAITLGAPFWFDLLNKMMVIRSTVKPHEKSPEESSEDRQSPAPRPAPPAAAPAAEPTPEVGTPFIRREFDDPGFQPNEWKDLADPQEGDL
jgi:hypothetical protein